MVSTEISTSIVSTKQKLPIQIYREKIIHKLISLSGTAQIDSPSKTQNAINLGVLE